MQSNYLNTKADEIIRNHVMVSSGAGLVPVPLLDIIAVSAVHLNMLRKLATVYDVSFEEEMAKSVISSVGGSALARIGASMVKSIPVIGTFLGGISMSALAGGTTYALGQVFKQHFSKGGGSLKDLDLEEARELFDEELEKGKAVAEELKNTVAPAEKSLSDQTFDKLERLADLKDKGIITEEEFVAKKERLLDLI